MSQNLTNLEAVEKLLGPIRKEQLNNTDNFISDKVAMFMPVLGFCDYAVTAMHSHPSYHFILAFNDQVLFKIGSRNVIAKPKMLLVISPNVLHKEIIVNKFPRYIAIFIDKQFFEEQMCQYSMKRTLDFDVNLIPLPNNFLATIKEFMIEVDNQIPGWESVSLANNLKICHYLIRSILNLNQKQDKITHRLEIDETIQYMYSNLDKKITVEDLAKIAHMSPSYYTRAFKKATGQSSISYLNQIRLERVKRLLLEGDKAITEIALECGFSSTAYLSSSFHNKFKISPTDYRNLLKKGDISKV